MKVCLDCNNKFGDEEYYCPRCGSSNIQNAPAQQQKPRPQQNPNQQRPVQNPAQRPVQNQGQRPMNNQGQRPVQNQGQRPVQNQGQRPMNNQGQRPVQRPVQNQGQRPPQNQRPVQNQGQRPPQNQQANGFVDDFDIDQGINDWNEAQGNNLNKQNYNPGPNYPQNNGRPQGMNQAPNQNNMGGPVPIDNGKKNRKEKPPKQPKQPVQPVQNNQNTGYRTYYGDDEVVYFKDWIILMLKCIVPLYNIYVVVTLLIGGPKYKKSMTNYARAAAVMAAAITVITIVISLVVGGSLLSAFKG